MKFIKKILLIAIFGILVFAATIQTEAAASQSKAITYDVNEDGSSRITYDIKLVNDNPNTYISKYTLSTGFDTVSNIEAKLDSGKVLNNNVITNDSGASIEIFFPDPRSSQSEVNWSISFSTGDLVETVGKTKEIKIPGFVGDFDLSLTVLVPKSFGKANYISPAPDESSELNQKYIYKYTTDSFRKTGISISLGEAQAYKFTYKYKLKNDDADSRLRVTIALPPDYRNQKVFYDNFEPQPTNGYKDLDGNYIAEYLLLPNEEFDVLIEGKALLTSGDDEGYKTENLNFDELLKSDTYWESDKAEIISLAEEITKNARSDREKGKAIYDYVVANLKYNTEALSDTGRERLGAVAVLENKTNAICQEYTDLFVALARASKLPARMLAGYTTSQVASGLPDAPLHAWAEFYTKEEGWITVDPTWGSTSEGRDYFGNVGLDHFVLAIRGIDSETPPLVQSFISAEDSSDNLVIEPISDTIEKTGDINLIIDVPSEVKTLIKNNGVLKIVNNTNVLLSDVTLTPTVSDVNVSVPSLDAKRVIFPGDEISIDLPITANSLLKKGTENLMIKLDGTLQEKDIVSSEVSTSLNIQIHNLLIYGFIALALAVSIGVVMGVRLIIRRKSATAHEAVQRMA